LFRVKALYLVPPRLPALLRFGRVLLGGGRGRDTSFPDTPRTDPYRRSLAHTALISDGWRRSDLRDMDGAHVDEEAIGGQGRCGVPM
jgi:hypothetical protein